MLTLLKAEKLEALLFRARAFADLTRAAECCEGGATRNALHQILRELEPALYAATNEYRDAK